MKSIYRQEDIIFPIICYYSPGIVYDLSAMKKNEMRSLNECLNWGPVILQSMHTLLLRFKTKKIGIIEVIEKAVLQVVLQEQKRDAIRFQKYQN